jgi:hypothetical protein
MSFLQPFNFSSFGPNFGPNSLFHQQQQVPLSPSNRFNAQLSPAGTTLLQPQQQQSYHHQQQQAHNLPLPQSIDPNYNTAGSQSTDYYGNPLQLTEYQRPQQQQQRVTTGYRSLPAQVLPRKRRPKKVSQRNAFIPPNTRVTPIQGPIYARDGYVPVVPLYSYNAVNNGTLYQIPVSTAKVILPLYTISRASHNI